MRNTLILKSLSVLALTAWPALLPAPVHADAPATQPAAAATTDTPDVKAVRDALLDWDKNTSKRSLEEERKSYHADNDKEAQFMDFVAHENWEESKAQQAIRDKWGAEAEAKFAHFLTGSTLEDDQVCDIKVEGDHATATWDNIKGSTPLKLVKVDGHWLVDGHAIYEDATKDDPTKAPELNPTGKVMKQSVTDIAAGKFDDFDAFLADFKTKYGGAAEGN